MAIPAAKRQGPPGHSLTLATTGLFESILTVHTLRKAAKADATGEIFTSSTNHELIALRTANAVAGWFNALLSFGGYGRSKLNVAAGGRTPMSSVFLSLMIAICLLLLLPAFHYVPKCVLAALLTEVGVSMIEESSSEIAFFCESRAVVRSSTQAGVSLHPIPASSEAAADNANVIRKITVCFPSDLLTMVNITGQLMFTSSDNFERRLSNTRALQRGKMRKTALARSSSNPLADQQVISPSGRSLTTLFNFGPSATINNCATQTLLDIVQEHRRQGIVIWLFSPADSKHHCHILQKLTLSGIVDLCGGSDCFLRSEREVFAALEQIEQIEQIEQHCDEFPDILDV
ncbi:uncharacterized protein Z519_00267 [Cladophialophora bantiana CBS 173.52]|uniref:STAS domain-containing protein n=1 Tax=Cladophialophora bantiana (strain ATCC 10958 / CBS 173.52 / CDC B-1940 / NIH 8579) TaxID=1442370 RepID=A0A0D2F941_CLAB1|nr:uncharacterized protein Z519_00267 [Cladophialophora bantiana CBS 173.52]KIW98606.1 hypothetical protein Z519_00267 [Cladophialophora bantiana CBS 173.52]